jgi:hypothetical protein
LNDIEKDSKIKIPYSSESESPNCNVFCFDSEAFRLLCCLKEKIEIRPGIKAIFAESWKNSAETAYIMLKYISQLDTHSVLHTITLNEAKKLIYDLAKPISDIMQKNETNIKLSKDKMFEIKNIDSSVDDLKKHLFIEQIDLEPSQLNYPRTVCTNSSCVQIIQFGSEKKLIM